MKDAYSNGGVPLSQHQHLDFVRLKSCRIINQSLNNYPEIKTGDWDYVFELGPARYFLEPLKKQRETTDYWRLIDTFSHRSMLRPRLRTESRSRSVFHGSKSHYTLFDHGTTYSFGFSPGYVEDLIEMQIGALDVAALFCESIFNTKEDKNA